MADSNVVEMVLKCTPQGLELFDQAGKKVGDLGRAAKEAEQSFSLFSAKGAAAATAVAGMATAVAGFAVAAGAAKAGWDAFSAGVARGSAFNDLSQRLGVSVETLSKLELAAKTSGVSLDGLGAGIQQLSRNMVEAASGGKEAQAAFAALGISAAELKSLNTEQVLGKIADSFAGANDGAAKTAIAMQLLGRAGAQMIPLLNEGSVGLQRFGELSERLGLTMTREMAAAFDSIGDSMDILGSAVEGVQSQFAIGMAPALEEVAQALVDLVADMGIANGTIRSLGENVGGWLKDAFESLRGTIEETQGLFATLDFEDAMGIVGERLNKALESAFESAIWAAARAAKNVFMTAVEWAFGSVDISSVIASKNEELIREQVGNLERELSARYGAGGLEAARADAPFDANVRNLVENVDALKGRLGELAGAQLVAQAAASKNSAALVDQQVAGNLAALGINTAGDAWRFYEQAGESAGKNDLNAPLKDTGDAAKKLSEELHNAAVALSASEAIYDQAASGTISLAEANLRAAAASAVLAKGVTDEKTVLAALAIERQKAAIEATKETASLVEAAAASERRVAILDEVIAAGRSGAEAEQLLAQATIEAHAADVLATTGSQEKADQYRQAAEAARASAQAEKDRQAVLSAQNRTQNLQLELSLTQQVNQGLISELDKKIQIARAQADGVEALADQYEQQVRIQEAIEDQQAAYVHLGDAVKDSFEQAFDAVIAGTRDMGDVLEGIGVGIGKRFFSAMLESKLRDFDPTVKANFLDLGNFGQGIFSKLFSGGSTIGGSGGSGDGLFKQAADWIGGLFEGAGVGDYPDSYSTPGNSSDFTVGGDGELYGYSEGAPPEYVGTRGPSTSSFGNGAANAAVGAVTAYSLFQGIDDTGLEGIIAKGTESGVISAANNIGQIFGAIVGAVASIYLGPLGGIIGGVVGSGLSALIGDAVNRDALLQGHLDKNSFLGVQRNPAYFAFDAAGSGFMTAQIVDVLLSLPTLGLALRKGAESILDESETFASAQSRWGDITVRSGGPESVYRNNLTGADTARARGFTDTQVNLTRGATSAIFNQIAEGEMAEDAGRLGEAMGNIMAEFLSRGLEDGVEFEPMFDLLRQFAHEAGIDVLTTMRSLNTVQANSIAAAERWGKLDPMAAAAQGARSYAEALVGATEVFENDYPQGVHLASIALRNLEKDGVNAFGEIDDAAKETLFNLSKDTELTTDIIEKLVAQGFTIDTEEFERQLSAISQSAALIGQQIGEVFNFDNVGVGVQGIFESLKGQILDVFSKESIKQLFDTTNIASAFEPVFAVLDRIDEFDLTTAQGSQDFMGQLLPALAEGKANLQAYIPILQVMADNWKELQKLIDEAMKPDVFEQAAQIAEEGFNGIGGALNSALEAGMAVLEDGGTWEAAVNVFNSTFGSGVQKSFKDAIFNAIVQSAVIQPLIATFQPAFEYVIAAGFAVGFSNPRVREAIGLLLGQVSTQAKELGLVVFQAKVDSDGITSDIEKAFNDAADITVDWANDLKGGIEGALNSAFDVLASGGSRDEALAAWNDAIGSNTRDAVLRGIVLALIDAAIIEPFIKQWAPVIQYITSGAIAQGWDDPLVQDAIDKNFGPGSKFIQDLNNIGPVAIDFYGRIIGYEDSNGNAVDLDGGGTGRLDLDGSQTGGGRKTPGRGLPGAAAGGTFGLGQDIIVGENGPELITSGPDGITVTPLSPAQAASMLDPASTQGRTFPDGGRDFPTNPPSGGGRDGRNPIDLNPHTRDDDFRSPTSRPRVPPPPGRHPGTTGVGTVDVQVDLNLDDAIEAFLRGGSLKDFQDALDEGTKKAVLDGVIKGMLESGPIKNAIDAFNKQMDDAVTKAMRDGVIDGQEQADLNALSEKLSGGIETATKQMQPVVEAVGRTFGLGVEASTKEAIEGISSDLDKAIRTFLEGGSLTDMEEAVNRSLYDATTSAIIKALVTTGPLASVIDKFGAKVGDAIADALDDGKIDAKEARRIRRIGKKYGAEISDAIEALGPILGPLFEDWAGQLGINIKNELATVEGVLGNALKQAILNGDSIATLQTNIKQALYDSVVDGMVSAFVDSAVVQGLLAGPMSVINGVFAQIADHQITVAEANQIILTQFGAINGLLNDPTFLGALQTFTNGIADLRAALGLTVSAAGAIADGFQGVADTATDATEAECEWERRLVEGQEKNAILDEYGRQGYEAVETYGPVKPGDDSTHDPWDDVPDTLVGGNGVYGHPSDLVGYWERREIRKNRRRNRRRGRPSHLTGGPGSVDGDGDWSRPGWLPMDDGDFVGPNAAATNSGPMLVRDEGISELRQEVASLREAIMNMPAPVVNLDGREISKNSRRHERRESRGAQSTQWGIS